MKSIYLFAACLAAGAAATLTSCENKSAFIGSWTAASPSPIGAEIPAASSATSLLSVDFQKNPSDGNSGPVYFTSIIEATQPVTAQATEDLSTVSPYEVSVSATAAINGTWHFKDADKDDLLITFDMSSLSVDVDPSGVAFSENMLTGAQQPMVDSLTNATAARWKSQIEAAVKTNLARFTELEDIEVSGNGSALSFEIKDIRGNDNTVVLRRVIDAQ